MVQTIRDLLVESVRLRLRSDVPWAVYLSGGIDSSAVAGIATQLLREKDPNAKLTAFNLAFVGMFEALPVISLWSLTSIPIPESEATDESPLAERTAAHIGADLVKVEATEAKLVGVLEECVWHSETVNTTFHGPGKFLLSKAVNDAGYKVNSFCPSLIQTLIMLRFQVALSGEGSDEVFGGYPWFLLDYLRDPDPAAAKLGISLPSATERQALAEEYQAATGMKQLPPDALSLHKSDGPRHLLKISAHLSLQSRLVLQGTVLYRPGVVEAAGGFSISRCIEEGIDTRVRQNSISGDWHSLNVSLVCVRFCANLAMIILLMLENSIRWRKPCSAERS